jgi:rhodanese-related sulfurtransferase
MNQIAELLATARQRAADLKVPYAGALTPREAHEVLSLLPQARLVDVRTRAEWDFVGRVPSAAEIQFLSYPDNAPNAMFAHQVEAIGGKDATLFFMCRTGGRSHAAAASLAAAGFTGCFNVLEGFEGDKDEAGHRNTRNGWRAAGLPWVQG